jgi:hypothetical protein
MNPLLVGSFDNYLHYLNILTVGITFVGLTYYVVYSYAVSNYNNLDMVRPIDASRVEGGLPTELAFTPEELRDNPELAEIFEITDVENGLALALESNAHNINIENQNPILAFHNTVRDEILMRINADVNFLDVFINADEYGDILMPISDILIRHYATIESFISSFF